MGSRLPGIVVAFDVGVGRDVGSVHEAGVVRSDCIRGSQPAVVGGAGAEFDPEEVDVTGVV